MILSVIGLVAALLVLLGLPALYSHQAKQAGRLGLTAFVLVFIGMALVVSNAYFGTFIQGGLVDLIILAEGAGVTVQEPVAAGVGFLSSMLLYLLGWILFGVVSFRAKVFPRWAVAVLLFGLALGFLFLATGISWLGLPVTEMGIAALGFVLWQKKVSSLPEPALAR